MSKNIAILGAGESGTGAAVLAKKKGYDVFVSDEGNIQDRYKKLLKHYEIDYEEGIHSTDRILKADEIVKSPGIPNDVEILKSARRSNIPILSEIAFASQFTKATVVGITGTNGKSTTTALTNHLLKEGGLDTVMVGNIGQSFALQVAEKDHAYYVMELSSFQLEQVGSFKPHIAVMLNITPDHLDRYNDNMKEYIKAKFNITQNQGKDDYFIYCADDERINKYLSNKQVEAQLVPFTLKKKSFCPAELKPLTGQF